jgi:hypothetical protein
MLKFLRESSRVGMLLKVQHVLQERGECLQLSPTQTSELFAMLSL